MNHAIKTRTYFLVATLLTGALALGCEARVEGGGSGSGASDGTGAGGSSGTSESTSSSTSTGMVSCWKDFGPDAPGECTIGDERDCPPSDTPEGAFYCREKCVNINGAAVWGLKTTDFECPFYDSPWHLDNGPQCECNTPLVLSFDRAPVEFTAAKASYAFDLTRSGRPLVTDWPTARSPWLALDRDGDGRINGGGELFGSATRLANGRFAENGFIALRELDANGDGRITPEDPGFAKLVVWSDRDGDRSSTTEEITTAASMSLLSIDLDYVSVPRCDERGNCEVERASFRFRDEAGMERTGAVIDVHFRAQ